MSIIAIGTAQFGYKYGINYKKKTSFFEKKKIITQAEFDGFKFIDTSPVYGDAENVIGRILKPNHSFNIITKTTLAKGSNINYNLIEDFKKNFFLSLKKLKQTNIYALLIHNSDDLFKKNSEKLYRAIKSLKDNKLIKKIGVSVYEKREIDAVLRHYDFDIFQIPCNILDQRLIQDGTLEILDKKNIEMHARSVFLQGLLLMKVNELPNYFKPIYLKLSSWHKKLKDNNISPVNAALSFAMNLKKFKSIIVGFNNYKQFQQVSSYKFIKLPFLTDDLICNNRKYIDPRYWKNL
jgi:aryl-alcohol dehydrogenase-like predicted oxidoreductase